jgi:hypothetical protein
MLISSCVAVYGTSCRLAGRSVVYPPKRYFRWLARSTLRLATEHITDTVHYRGKDYLGYGWAEKMMTKTETEKTEIEPEETKTEKTDQRIG